jgi:septal ring factor EnvC (AmiA/AmiB activator)
MCLKKSGTGLKTMLLWSLVLLVFCSHTCLAEVVLKDDEATLLKQSLTTAEKELTQQASRIESLETSLTEAEKQLAEAKSTQQGLQTTIEEQQSRLEQLSTSLKEQKKEQRKQKFWTGIKIVGAFVIGGAVGYTAGSLF